MKLLPLTEVDIAPKDKSPKVIGKVVLVIEKIESFDKEDANNYTFIIMDSGSCIRVMETPEQIVKAIEDSCKMIYK